MNKTLFFHPNNDFTGSTRVLANLIESEYAGKKVTIITMNVGNGFLTNLSNVHIIPIYCFRVNNRRIPVLTGLIWRIHAWFVTLLLGWSYDIFYINTIKPYYAAVVGWLYHKKIIYHIHEKFIIKSMNIKLFEFVFNHVQAKRIFVSEYVKSKYPLKVNCECVVQYNILPKSFLSKVRIKPIEERERNVIIMITSLSKAKGIFTYLEVARKLPTRLFFLLVSSDVESIKKFLGTEVPKNIRILPTQSDIHPFLQTSDLIVNLSMPNLSVETFGMTILEAMAYGIPAIVPNVGGPTELIIDGYNGYCIDVCDVDSVALTIEKVFCRDEYCRLASNSLERVNLFI